MSFPSLVANAACLELVNTVNNWNAPRRDLLDDAADARAWAELVVEGEVRRLDRRHLALLRETRADLRAVFTAVAHGRPEPQAAVDRLLATTAAALGRASLRRDGDTFDVLWPRPASGSDLVGVLAQSAVDLLTRGPLDRVGECPACGWLFVDTSRNGRRAWCSMETCGSRVKARRYYERRSH